MLRVFDDNFKFFGYCKLEALGRREFVLHIYEDPQLTLGKHHIRIDGPEFCQIDKLGEREGIELLFPIYHDGHILKYFFNTLDDKSRNNVRVEDGRAFYCNNEGEEVENGFN